MFRSIFFSIFEVIILQKVLLQANQESVQVEFDIRWGWVALRIDRCINHLQSLIFAGILGPQDEFPTDGVDLYDDVITTEGRPEGEAPAEANANEKSAPAPVTPSNNINSVTKPISTPNSTGSTGSTPSHDGHRDSIMPLRKHQAYVGNLTWVRTINYLCC